MGHAWIRGALVAGASLAALAAVACAGVVGIQDRSLDPVAACGDPCPMRVGLNHPFIVTADENNVYWTEFGDSLNAGNGSVSSCPVLGCPADGPLVYAQSQTNARGIAVDAQNVYWASSGGIWSCPIAGCQGLPTKVVAADDPFTVVLDDANVYWTDDLGSTVHSAPKGGGPDTVLSDGGHDDGGGLNGARGFALAGGYAFVTDKNYDLFRLPIGGGDLTLLYTPDSGIYVGSPPLSADPSGVYLGSVGELLRFDPSGTGPGTQLSTQVGAAIGLRVDPSGSLYFADYGSGSGKDGTVGKLPTAGGTTTLLAHGVTAAEDVAINGTYVFWLSSGTPLASGDTTIGTGVLYRGKK